MQQYTIRDNEFLRALWQTCILTSCAAATQSAEMIAGVPHISNLEH